MPTPILKHRLADGSIRVRVTNSDYRFVITGRRESGFQLTALSWSKDEMNARKMASSWRSKGPSTSTWSP